jgi:hypothetical protein
MKEGYIKVVRTITYEGTPEWIERRMCGSLADGVHSRLFFDYSVEGTITIHTEGHTGGTIPSSAVDNRVDGRE